MVQKRLWALLALMLVVLGCAPEPAPTPAARAELSGDSVLVEHFRDAERASGVPAALLATIAYVQTRLEPPPTVDDLPGHAPREHGIMAIGTGGLTTLGRAAELAALTEHEVATESRANVRAAAVLLADFSRALGAATHGDAEWRGALVAYGGEALAGRVLRLLADGWKSTDAHGQSVEVTGHGFHDGLGTVSQAIGFPGSIWNPANSGNYTNASRGAAQINYVVIHTTQGSYAGTISWFKNPSSNVSSHYVVRSSDGEVTQMVDDADIAWHDGCFNSESIGIEHEGYVSDPGKWYTDALYSASAKLTAWLCDVYGIPKDRQHIMGHSETPDCSDHTDPGGGWNWDKYMDLVKGGGATAQNCSTSQAGACGNYGCWCVNGECNGGFCPGTGCTAQDNANCAAYGCQCVDGQCNGGFCPGQGCTAKEVTDCAAYGCQCVDHQCNGGFCPGQGCTAKELNDCAAYGCGCVDHKCSGAFCEGSGCTAKQTVDCDAKGKSCKDGKCVEPSGAGGSGGEAGAGTGGSGTSAGGSAGSGGGSAGGNTSAGGSSGSSWGGGSGGDGAGGSAGGNAKPEPAPLEDVDGGCACRAAPSASGTAPWLLIALGALLLLRRRAIPLVVLLPLAGCASPAPDASPASESCEEPVAEHADALSSIDCSEGSDTGYSSGNPFPITVVTVDGKKVEKDTANAYYVMAQAAAAAGVNIKIVSGFRTMGEQQYLYNCYINCSCNNCNLAAKPGYSNHQSGHALDLNTSSGGVYGWLEAHGAAYGFKRTVPSEPWHWEWWGGGPGGGPCGTTPQNCSSSQASACGNYGCWCVNGECNGGFCPGSGCTAQDNSNCAAYGCQCVDGQCNGGFCPGQGCTAKEVTDCAAFGCQCVDHQCNGGFCPGQGCTAKEVTDCAAYGCQCVDHACNGGFCPGQGCTAKETLDCEKKGCGCVDHKCSGGSCEGTGCTAKQTVDCDAKGKKCKDTKCVAASGSGGSAGSGGGSAGSGTASGGSSSGAAGSSGGVGGAGGAGGGWGSPSGGSSGDAGATGASAPAGDAPSEDIEGSCACRSTARRAGSPWLLAALLGLWAVRRCRANSGVA